MATLNELKYSELFDATGATTPVTLNELEIIWLASKGYTTGTLQERYHQWFDAEGIAEGTYNERFCAYLIGLGYTGTFNEMLYQWYTDGLTSLVFQAIYPDITTEMQGVLTGIGDLTEANTSTRYYPDFESVWRSFGSGVAGYSGGRKVENLCTYSEDYSNAAWAKSSGGVGTIPVVTSNYAASPDGGLADRVQMDLNAGSTTTDRSRLISTSWSENAGVASIWLKSNTVSTDIIYTLGNNVVAITVTTAWQRFAITPTSAPNSMQIGLRGTLTDDTADLMVYGAQAEDTTGRTLSTTPSAYIPTTTAAVQKVYASTNNNSVASNVVTEVAPTAFTAANYPWLVGQKACTNLALHSDDGSDAAWAKFKMTAIKTADGLRGEANGGTTLTATGNNATSIQTVTQASGNHASRFFLRRKTGTGTVEICVDGSTWTAVTLTADYDGFQIDQAAVTNPQIGVRIVTSGDEVEMGNGECHAATTQEAIRRSSPLFTAGSTTTINVSDLSFDILNHDETQGLWYAEVLTPESQPTSSSIISTNSNSSGQIYDRGVNNQIRTNDGVTTLSSAGITPDVAYKAATAYGSSELALIVDGAAVEGAYDGSFGTLLGNISILMIRPGTGVRYIRDIRRYDESYADALVTGVEITS